LCREYKVPEVRFDRCLDYLSTGWPKKQIDAVLDTGEAKGLYWVKLPATDKRSLILGDITNCCQSIGGDSEGCVKDAASLADNGLYVLVKALKKDRPWIVNGEINDKDFKIIGQSYVWKSLTGNICLDSIECLKGEVKDSAIKSILSDFASKVLDENPDIQYVTVGSGGNTPRGLFGNAMVPEKILHGYQYGDSERQYCIAKAPHRSLSVERREELQTLLQRYPERVRNYMDYLIDYLRDYQDDPDRIVERLKPLLKQDIQSIGIHLDEKALIRLLSIDPPPSIDDLIAVDLNALETMTHEERTINLKDVSVTRLMWTGDNNYKLLLAIPYLSDGKFLKAIKIKDKFGDLIFHYAAKQPDILLSILTRLPQELRLEAVMSKNHYGDTLWHDAADNPESLASILSCLSTQISDIEFLKMMQTRGRNGETVLHRAAKDPASLTLILTKIPKDKRFDALMLTDTEGKTTLHRARGHQSCLTAILIALIKDMSDEECLEVLQKKDTSGSTLLHYVANIPTMMTSMLSRLPEDSRFKTVMLADTEGKTILHHASSSYPRSCDALIAILMSLPEPLRFDALMAKDNKGDTIIREFEGTEDEWLAVLNCLPKEKRLDLLKASPQLHKTNKDWSSKVKLTPKILNSIPEDQRFEILMTKNNENKTILQQLTSYNAKDSHDLMAMIWCLPKDQQVNAVKATELFDNYDKYKIDWAEWISRFEENQRVELVTCKNKMGKSILDHVALTPGSLTEIFANLTKEQHSDIVKNSKILFWRSFKKDHEHVIEILNSLSVDLRFEAVMTKNDDGETCLDTTLLAQELISIINQLPADRRFEAVMTKNKKGYTVFDRLTEPDQIVAVLNSLPEDFRSDAVMATNQNGETLLHRVVKKEDCFISILNGLPENKRLAAVMAHDKNGQTVLHYARSIGCLKAILNVYPTDKQRLDAVMAKDANGNSVLHSYAHNFDCFKVILQIYPEEQQLDAVMGKDKQGKTLLHKVAFNPEHLNFILKMYPKEQQLEAVMEKDENDRTVLYYAAQHPDSLKTILNVYQEKQQWAAVMAKDKHGKTVLHAASNHLDALRVLLNLYQQDQRIDAVMTTDNDGLTVLHHATFNPDCFIELWNILSEDTSPEVVALKMDALLNPGPNKTSVLARAAKNCEQLLAILNIVPIEQLFDALTTRNGLVTPFDAAQNHPDCLIVMLNSLSEEKRFDAVIKNQDGQTLLQKTAEKPDSLAAILGCLSKKQQLEAIKMSGLLQQLAWNKDRLFKCFLSLPEDLRFNALAKDNSGISILDKIYEPSHLSEFLSGLPEERRFDAITAHPCFLKKTELKELKVIMMNKIQNAEHHHHSTEPSHYNNVKEKITNAKTAFQLNEALKEIQRLNTIDSTKAYRNKLKTLTQSSETEPKKSPGMTGSLD